MHSSTFFTVLAAAALTAAAPATVPLAQREPGCPLAPGAVGAYYTCYNNGFKGYCSSDPCDKAWCPDFKSWTCEPATTTSTPPSPVPVPQEQCPGTGAFYICASNKFKGYCSSDPCDKAWCPDFEPNTCQKKTTPPPAQCPGTGAFYVCASNKFQGYCSSDPCAQAWCPDFEANTCVKKTPTTATPAGQCAGKGAYYRCANNGFQGQCSSDPCDKAWCPDFYLKSCIPIGASS